MKITIQVDAAHGDAIHFLECPYDDCTWSVLGSDEWDVQRTHQAHVVAHTV